MMKKIYLISFLILFLIQSSLANKVEVSVANNDFSPSNLIVYVGDTIIWTWASGIHTTSSTEIPANVQRWNAMIDATHTSFMYVVTQPGAYEYQCNFHYSNGMIAGFTALATTGINDRQQGVYFNLKVNSSTSELKVELNTPNSGALKLIIFNIIGKQIKELAIAEKNAGQHFLTYDITDLEKGIYLVRLTLQGVGIVRKMVVE